MIIRAALILAIAAALTGCGKTVRVTLRGEVMIAENRAAIGTGIYSGSELQERRLDGGRDLRKAREAKVFLDIETSGQDLRLSIDHADATKNFRFSFTAEGLGSLRGIKLAIMVPGIGRTDRYYPRPQGPTEEFELDFMAVLKERP